MTATTTLTFDYENFKYENSFSKISYECKVCGCKNSASVDNLIKGRDCPSCAITGFNPNKKGYFYIQQLGGRFSGLVNIGITNKLEQRLKTHAKTAKKHDLEIIKVDHIEFNNGYEAQALEATIKRELENFYIPAEGFKTETFVFEAVKPYLN